MTISKDIYQDSQTIASQSDGDVILSVKGVSKKFCRTLKRSLLYGVQDIASELSGLRGTRVELRKQEFWALKEVSFQLRKGEALGLVGKNGSGKSTLLRIIAGLIKPDAGTVKVVGRVAPLIALGAGFNPLLTGRENIYANMAILGLSRKEIDEQFEEVIDFAEIGDAIDSPVQNYSSGMAARLGFACAINTNPDILLVDEVLAIGDIKFRSKCYRKLDELRKKQIAFVMVSHDLEAIYAVCETAHYIKDGISIASGSIESVMQKYQEDLFGSSDLGNTTKNLFQTQKNKLNSGGLDIISIFFRDKNTNQIDNPVSGERVNLCLKVQSHQLFDNLGVRVLIRNSDGEVLFIDSMQDRWNLNLKKGSHEINMILPYLGLNPGSYIMDIWLLSGKVNMIDFVPNIILNVNLNKNIGYSIRSQFCQPRFWTIQSCIDPD